MQRDVGTSREDGGDARGVALRCASGWPLLALVLTCMGCQTMQPIPSSSIPSNLSRGLSSSYKPPLEAVAGPAVHPSATPAATLPSPAARVRGQSPTQWNTSAPGSNAYRSPMAPSDARAPSNVPNPGATAPGPSATLSSSNTSYQNPLNQTAVSPYAAAGAPPYGTAPYSAPSNGAGGYGYAAPGAFPTTPSPSDYGSTIAPGATQPQATLESTIAPGAFPGLDPSGVPFPDITAPGGSGGYRPRQRVSPIDIYVQEARTGRIILGGSVNSNLGVAGQLVISENNFDIRNLPTSWRDMWSGRAFRGGGQNFRAEFMPGNQVQRYTVNWTESNLFGYLPYSLSVGGFYFTRQYRDWTEQRLGGRAALGYAITKDLSISGELRLEDVNIFNPRVAGVQQLDRALGSNDLYTARFRIARDTRDSPFLSTEGALLEVIFDQVFGEYDYSRGNVNYSRYFNVHERSDGGGRHIIASTWKFGVTGSQTPVFENYFAGGYNTLRGFSFRGASPKVNDVQVGGELMFLGSLEYVFPLTADEMLRGVAFCDYGTVEQDLSIHSKNFRVSPGLGLRVSVPALGPAPLAFDFAVPVNRADTDQTQVFSFFMGVTR